MSRFRIAVIPGDGIGPEVTNSTQAVLEKIAARFGHSFQFEALLAGGIAIDATGMPLPPATVIASQNCHAVLLGAVGGPQWDTLPGDQRPERALLGLRASLGLYANLRPAILHQPLAAACPLHPAIARSGIDMMIVRELTGGMYFGDHGRRDGVHGPEAYDTECYSVFEVERIARTAFDLARGRKKRLLSVDKANVLESSRLWRETIVKVAADYPDVSVSHMYVDNASMQLIRQPSAFDVIVTSNMFGDILSDEAAMITGSIGMLPSASLGAPGKPGLYEPVHGSAPDIAGKDIANPLAAILSGAMLLRLSLGLDAEADAIDQAVNRVLADGYRTADIAQPGDAPEKLLGTRAMCDQVLAAL